MVEAYVLRQGKAGQVLAFDGAGQPAPYAAASLFLLASHGENFGLSIAEAVASGLPVLVTDTTPWSGLNRTGAGWCVPWSDFADALRSATSEDAATLRSRGEIGREWVLREYSWEKAAQALSRFYSGLRAGARERRP
jgi:glycosyltransferase involved in cell wall biosynthesis